jgi:hypothetical protein
MMARIRRRRLAIATPRSVLHEPCRPERQTVPGAVVEQSAGAGDAHPPAPEARQTLRVRVIACAGAGFLLAVLWFDLMFDVQARGHAGRDLPSDVLASISAYYARVTTAARPMNRLVAGVMLTTLAAIATELARDALPTWRATLSLVAVVGAIGLAAGRTVPSAVRLGRRADDVHQQSRLARVILRDHLVCISAIVVVLVLQLLPV